MTRTWSPVFAAALLVGLAACQEPGQRGPMERTGAYIDQKVTDAQRGVAEFSQRAGQSLDRAGRSVGAGAERVGTTVHDNLMPADPPPAPPPSADPGWTQQPVSTRGNYTPTDLPAPTRMSP